MLAGLSGVTGWVASVLRATDEGADITAEAVSPGASSGFTTTGNLIGPKGVSDDAITGVETGDYTGSVERVYSDIIGPGGVVHNLGQGYGLGVEGLLGNVLSTADELLG